MSIVRIGLAETRNFADGYDAIFGKKKTAAASAKPAKKSAGAKAAKPKPGKKKKTAKRK